MAVRSVRPASDESDALLLMFRSPVIVVSPSSAFRSSRPGTDAMERLPVICVAFSNSARSEIAAMGALPTKTPVWLPVPGVEQVRPEQVLQPALQQL